MYENTPVIFIDKTYVRYYFLPAYPFNQILLIKKHCENL